MTAAQKPLFLTLCANCGGTTRVPEAPDDPGTGWTVPCPACNDACTLCGATPETGLRDGCSECEGITGPQGREYDPDRATIPY